MSVQIDTPFVAYSFTEQEASIAMTFTTLQEQHIRTELAMVATERCKMALDPANFQKSFGELEYLRGKMEALEALLATHQNEKDKLEATLQAALSFDAPAS